MTQNKAPPLMPRFGLGDIVSVTGKFEGDWFTCELMIVGVVYCPKRDLLTYWTAPADKPASEGATTDWLENDLSLVRENKYNTRTSAILDSVVDASKWRALMSSARITAMGWAGFYQDQPKPDDGYRHLTLNFWTRNEGGDAQDQHGRKMLEQYVADIIAQKEAQCSSQS